MPGEVGPPKVDVDAPTEESPLGNRPADDDLALNVAQARIASKLFGAPSEVAVGRYKLLELVGRGGMGVVWGAWDPELERKVAIKLVDHVRPDARMRIVDEARALAKLSHPNVVPVYDVGIVEDRVYLVMEWVAGATLRAHLRERRSVREIVDVYTQAARGLAAVHAAGLVHRDFKPENAIIGRDGRVRVLDFGLARADLDEAARGEIAGTPRYMAPEQLAGATPTAAVDVFALCMSLREALEARGGVPRWLAAIVARGTAAALDERFASMDEVIRELGRDPARVWRRRTIGGAALVATALAFAIGRSANADPCSGEPAPPVDPATLGRIASHLDKLGAFAASERPALLAILDRNLRTWRSARHAACVAHDRGELTTGLYERRLSCLARAEASLAVTAEILEHATEASFPDARVAASSLPDPAQCARVDQSLVPLPPPHAVALVRSAESAIARARMLATAARPEALDVAAAARVAAEGTAHAPVVARSLLVEGRAQMLAEDDRAAATLDRAMRVAVTAHDDATAVEAFARLAYVTAMREGVAVDGTSVMEVLATRLGPEGKFARLLLLNNLAVVRLATSDDPAKARPFLEAALREWRPGESDDDYELVSIPQNLALAIDDPARSLMLLTQARDEVARRLGVDHPKVLEIEQAQAAFVDLDQARTLVAGACSRLARLFPHLRDERADCEYRAGWLADEAGDQVQAAAHFAAAQLDPEVDARRLEIAGAMAVLARGTGDPAALARQLEASGDADATASSPWTRAVAADAYIAAARAWQAGGNRGAEQRCWERARVLLEAVSRPSTQRRLARARAAVAAPRQDRAE